MISKPQYRPVSRQIRTKRVSGPTAEPVVLAEYPGYLRLDSQIDNVVLRDKLQAARRSCEKHSGLAFVNQVWDLFMDLPPGAAPWMGSAASVFARYFGYVPEGIEIPFPPLITVLGVYGKDDSGTETVINPLTYWVSVADGPARIAQRETAVWPDTGGRTFETFRVRYAAGYVTPFTSNSTTNVLTAANHGLIDGTSVRVSATAGAKLPDPLVVDRDYFVINSAAGTLKLSLTLAGAAIDLTTDPTGTVFLGEFPPEFKRAIFATAAADMAPSNKKRGQDSGGGSDCQIPKIAREILDQERIIRI